MSDRKNPRCRRTTINVFRGCNNLGLAETGGEAEEQGDDEFHGFKK